MTERPDIPYKKAGCKRKRRRRRRQRRRRRRDIGLDATPGKRSRTMIYGLGRGKRRVFVYTYIYIYISIYTYTRAGENIWKCILSLKSGAPAAGIKLRVNSQASVYAREHKVRRWI